MYQDSEYDTVVYAKVTQSSGYALIIREYASICLNVH